MVLSSKFLAKCSLYIAVGGMTSVMIMRSLLIDKVKRQEYYQMAMKETRSSEGAKLLLGDSIRDIGTDLTEPNYANQEKAHFEVKLKGNKAKGSMFFWAEKPKEAEHWKVTRIELQLKDDDKRLLIKKPVVNSTVTGNVTA